MGLMAMLEEVLNGRDATVTVATLATVKPKTPPSVARVASVTVASGPKPKIERPTLRLVHTANTEEEAALHARRVQSFQAKGIADHQAATVADSLVKRDRQLDDRRSCAECASFAQGCCLQYRQPFGGGGVEVLHRCHGFKESER